MESPEYAPPAERAGSFLPALAVRRPVTALMLFLAMILLGVIAYIELPRQLLPSGFTPPFLYVHVPTRSAPPKDVETSIAAPIEEAFGTVRGVYQLRTFVRSGSAGFLVQFKDGTDMDLAYAQVRDRLDRTEADLPDEVGQYFIWKYNPSNDPVYWVGVTLPQRGSPSENAHTLQNALVRRLERIPGVSRVEVEGAPGREIRIEIDGERANASGLSTFSLVQKLQQDNFAMAAGSIKEGSREVPLRVVARFEDLDEVRKIPVAPGVLLQDVATVRYIKSGEDDVYRVNGKPGVILQVFKEGDANTVEVCSAVRKMLREDDPLLRDFHFVDFFDRGFHIEESLTNLQETAFWGGIFAIVVLFIFLQRAGITVMVTVAIPVSLLATLVVMYFTGSTLNALSLMGLMLSVGMVVDNSIVVVENIQRARLAGLGALQAAIRGTGEVALAILVATATTVVVFLPLILMSGNQTLSFYLGKVGYPVCIALIASLFVSLGLIPVASTLKLAGADKKPPELRFMVWMENKFASMLAFCLRRRADTVLIAILLVASTAWPINNLKETDTNAGNPNDFRIYFNFSPDMTHEEKNNYLQKAEARLQEISGDMGISDALTRLKAGWGRGRIRVFLKPVEERPEGLGREEIAEKTREMMPEAAGVVISANWSDQGAGDKSIALLVTGPDSNKLEQIGDDLALRLRNMPGVTSVQPQTSDESTQELQLSVARDLAQRRGLTPLLVGGSVDFALRGRRINDFHAPDREVRMTVLAPEEERNSLRGLQGLAMPDPQGGPGVEVGTITTTTLAPTYGSIDRQDRRTVFTISVFTDEEDLEIMGRRIDKALEGYNFPRGYRLDKGERFARLQNNKSERSFALALAILCVFLLMGVLFESFVLPLSIVISIPFAFAGVYWTLFVTGTSFDVMAAVGMVILVGVVVNNAVVLVDLVGQLQREGYSRSEALVEAGRRRLRPILMTALTTICGLLPMALGSASLIGIPYAPLGRTLIGGLTASTVLTLFVVPLCYTLFDDLRMAFVRLLLPGNRRTS